RPAPAAGAGPARRVPPALRRRWRFQLVGLPPGRLPPRPGPAHRPDPGLRRPAPARVRRRHRPRAAHLGAAERPRAGVGAAGGLIRVRPPALAGAASAASSAPPPAKAGGGWEGVATVRVDPKDTPPQPARAA